MITVTFHEAMARLPELVALAEAGGDVVIVRDSVLVVRFVAVASSAGQRKFGVLRGKVELPDAFFEPLSEGQLAEWEY